MTDSIIGLAEKIKLKKLIKKFIFFNLKQITGSIIGPAMAGPTGPFATALGLQFNYMVVKYMTMSLASHWFIV